MPSLVLAASPAGESKDAVALTFEAAQSRNAEMSAVGAVTGAELLAAREQAAASATLNRPTVALDAQLLRYQKTFDISLAGALREAESVADQLLPGIVEDLPSDVLADVEARLRAALPEFFAALPSSVRLRTADTTFRPVVSVVLPLYTGGAIPAARGAAEAGVGLADARRADAMDADRINLVRLYFGQVLSYEALRVALESRDSFDRHLANASAMEREGFLSAAQRLQVQVARDASQRQLDRAELENDSARRALATALSYPAVQTMTPLFVDSKPLPSLDAFIERGVTESPLVAQAESMEALAEAGVDLARSRFWPTIFAFGVYNLNRDHALPIEPDWAVGVGLHYDLLSSLDRNRTLNVARARRSAAESSKQQVRDTVSQLVIRTYNLTELSRRQFLSLDSSLAAAQENLRVQELAFREGEAPVSNLIDARTLFGSARLQRAAAAYEYVLSLAALLAASGQLEEFNGYLSHADRTITP
ncbi:TolC family protein [Povalibacter sp.]|uniref:TolC family protein n=1 Tax=Povalibacter sp. TaxID=1962978 RepID=UPI002F41203A